MMNGGGGPNSFGVVLTWDLEVLAILEGGAKCFCPLKRGGGQKKFNLVLRGGGGRKRYVPPNTRAVDTTHA